MKITFISKRRPQQRDLVDRPYGRFYYIPTVLAAMGHDIHVALCSHHGLVAGNHELARVAWSCHDIRALGPLGLLRSLEEEVSAFGPDWIVACSDAWFGPLAKRVARKAQARFAIDAYDNYEAYMPWNLPLHWQWRQAIAAADATTAAGPQLARLLDRQRKGKSPTAIVPMAADPAFVQHDRIHARSVLGLPANVPLIGYSGGWASNRGTQVLVDVFRYVRAQRPDARLVLTGRPPADVVDEPGVLALGYLPDAQLPFVLSALDVACIITANTKFGHYSYPAKLCEAMACSAPVVATATEPVRWMLRDDPRFLASVGDAHGIAERILTQLDAPCSEYGPLPSWESSARAFEAALGSPVM